MTELIAVANPISLTQQQKLNIQILAYSQAIRNLAYTAEYIYKLWPTDPSEEWRAGKRPSITAIQQYMSTSHYREGMYERGVEITTAETLTQEQTAAMMVLTDTSDHRSPAAKLKALGITSAKHRAWLKQKPYNDAFNQLASETIKEGIPQAKVKLAEAATRGDLSAIKFLFEYTGEYNPSQQQAIDAQQLVSVMVDAAQEVMGHDKELLQEYINLVKLKAQSVKGMVL